MSSNQNIRNVTSLSTSSRSTRYSVSELQDLLDFCGGSDDYLAVIR